MRPNAGQTSIKFSTQKRPTRTDAEKKLPVDPLLIPLYGAFSVFRCVRAYKESRLLRTHVRSKTPKFSFIGGWQSVRLTVCQEW